MTIDGIRVVVYGDAEIPLEELVQYVERGKKKYGGALWAMRLKVPDDCAEEVEIDYDFSHEFIRIRRITGYLVGNMDRWNDGKRAEEKDRVKHGVTA